jgi:hypothetical protein
MSGFNDNAGRQFFDGSRLGKGRHKQSPSLRYQRLDGATTRTTADGVQIIVGFVTDESFAARDAARATAHQARERAAAKVRARPRGAARRRREHRSHRRAQSPSRGDPAPGEPGAQLAADLIVGGGAEPLELARAGFIVFRAWTDEKWRRELSCALRREVVDLFIGGVGELWLRVVA